jgi:hypothetical protein
MAARSPPTPEPANRPVLASQRHAAKCSLGGAVVDFGPPGAQVSAQRPPARQRITNCTSQRRLGRQLSQGAFHPESERAHQWHSAQLAYSCALVRWLATSLRVDAAPQCALAPARSANRQAAPWLMDVVELAPRMGRLGNAVARRVGLQDAAEGSQALRMLAIAVGRVLEPDGAGSVACARLVRSEGAALQGNSPASPPPCGGGQSSAREGQLFPTGNA